MSIKRRFSMLVVCVLLLMSFSTEVMASSIEEQSSIAGDVSVRASGSFNMEVSGQTIVTASTSFPLEAGETVTIKASYSPFSASVDFGLIAPNGYFYYLNTSNGSFNKSIEVNERGYYTLAVRNNSTGTVSVSGYVNY